MQVRAWVKSTHNDWSSIMARSVVVVYFSHLGGRLRRDQKIMLEADAKAIAKIKRYDFGGPHQPAHHYSGPILFVPDDRLLLDEALSPGTDSAAGLYDA